jgi:2-keto-4-pentenoate hydratase/2-oxohepta-3-ene-1,7-dioic acid hydratase in catechol pathway
MDYELELSAVIGKPLPYGQAVTAEKAGEHIFGFVMLNDWSGKSLPRQIEVLRKLTCQQPVTYRYWR